MRRTFIAIASLAMLAACGGFLGFGDDDEGETPAPPAADGGDRDASGVVEVDAALVCEKLIEDFNAFTDQAQLPDASWRRFAGSPACALLGFDGGAFVTEIPAADGGTGGPDCLTPNAGIFRRFEGKVKSLDCSFDVTVSSFDGNGAFFEYRVEQGSEYSHYRTGAGWDDLNTGLGGVMSRARAANLDAGIDFTKYVATGAVADAGATFRVRAHLDARDSAGTKYTFYYPADTPAPVVTDVPLAGQPSFWELYLGVTATSRPGRAVTIDNVVCEACRQP